MKGGEIYFYLQLFPILETILYICPYRKITSMRDKIENIGLMIRNERLRKGLTQEELGERVGVGKAQISKIESGKGLTIKTVTKVLDALGMSVSVVLLMSLLLSVNLLRLIIFLYVRRTTISYVLRVLIF